MFMKLFDLLTKPIQASDASKNVNVKIYMIEFCEYITRFDWRSKQTSVMCLLHCLPSTNIYLGQAKNKNFLMKQKNLSEN